MGDGTPARDDERQDAAVTAPDGGGAAHGEGAAAVRPGVLTGSQENLLLAIWVQEALEDLRLNWGPEYEFGMLSGGSRTGWFAAWRKDAGGEPLAAAESPAGLRMLVRADAIADRDARNGTAP